MSDTATILLLNACKFEEPLVAKFHATGYESITLNTRRVSRAMPSYLPNFHITNNTVCDLAEREAMRAVGLLHSIPPLIKISGTWRK